MKGGTWQSESNAPGKVIFDNFEFGLNPPIPPGPPTVAAVCPGAGSTDGGTPVTITGSGFMTGATVSFGGVLATNVAVSSSTTMTAVVPAHAVGAVDVVVTNSDTQSGTLTNGFTYTAPPLDVILEENFNSNCIDTSKWTANDLLSGSHYRGIRTVNSYDFGGAFAYVELVQPPSASTAADAMFTVGYSVDNFYRIYVSGGNLIGQKKIGGVKTTLFTLSFDATNHRFWRIRHDAATNSVVLETAPTTGTGPGTWAVRYSESWNSSVELSTIQLELKGGTSQPESNAPGRVIFDNFLFSR
jgi:hypothetical protein